MGELNQERLTEPVPNSPFIFEDVVYSVMNGQKWAEPVNMPFNQMVLLIYFGLIGGHDLTTSNVVKGLLDLNIKCSESKDFKEYIRKIGYILHRLAEMGQLHYEEETSKEGRKYKLWKFSEYKNGLEK